MDSKNVFSNNAVILLLALLCCFLWGSAFPVIKIGYSVSGISACDAGSQILYAGIRFTAAGILVILISHIAARKYLSFNKKLVFKSAKLSLFQTILQYTFFYIGLARCTGVKSSVITASNVFLSILIAAFVFRTEKLSVQKVIGCIIGFTGVLLINSDGLDGGFRFSGEGFVFLAALSYAFSSGLIKKYSRDDSTVLLSGWQFFIGGTFMTLFGIIAGGRISCITVKGLLIIIYLSIVSAVAFSLWGTLLKYNPVSNVSVFGFMNPVFGVLLSYALLSEKNDIEPAKIFISLFFVVCGIIIVNTGFLKRK